MDTHNDSIVEAWEGTRLEWESLQDTVSPTLRNQIAEIVQRYAPSFAKVFYDTLLQDAEAAPLLSHELVSTRLHHSLQGWILSLFPLEGPPGFAAMAEQQVRVGKVHARIQLPLRLVTRGARLLRSSIVARLEAAALSPQQLVQAVNYVATTLDIAVELMNATFVKEAGRASRNEEAYRLFSLGQDVSVEREAQRAALAEWLQSVLFALASAQAGAAMPTISASEFGLWMQHRASLMFEGFPAIDSVRHIMDDIDHHLLPKLSSHDDVKGALEALQARANDIRYLVNDSFQAVAGLENGRDALTRTLNRRFLPSILSRETTLARQGKSTFSIIMVDVDHFKKINDQYGHSAGDIVLRQCADILLNSVRLGDLIFRYGGEEFLILLVESNASKAVETAERIRQQISSADIETSDGVRLRITASLGVAAFEGYPDYSHLIDAADKALYAAKAAGRNKVVLAAAMSQATSSSQKAPR